MEFLACFSNSYYLSSVFCSSPFSKGGHRCTLKNTLEDVPMCLECLFTTTSTRQQGFSMPGNVDDLDLSVVGPGLVRANRSDKAMEAEDISRGY